MDRCHRIGQTKPVHVYRLATAQSVEASDFTSPCSLFLIKGCYSSKEESENV